MDGRYRPELYGRNACDNTTSIDGYGRALYLGGILDKSAKPGVHVMWKAVRNNDTFVIDPNDPYELGKAWD